MVDRIQLSKAEKELLRQITDAGLRARVDQWTAARLGLARSLQNLEPPSPTAFKRQSSQPQGSTIHSNQMTGEGKGEAEDFTDLYRALLSVYEGRNLFDDDDAFHDALQQHVRRGIDAISKEWATDSDFHHYLANQLFAGVASRFEAPDIADDEIGPRIERVLGQLGVGAKILETVDGPRLTRFTLVLHELDDLDRLRRGVPKLSFALGFGEATVSVALATAERQVYLIVPRPPASWRITTWADLRPMLSEPEIRAMSLPICLGTDILGKAFVIDLADAPHLFVGGTTGSGKSMCLHSILLSLLENANAPQLVLIDPKAVEFSAYVSSKRLRGPVTTSSDDALAVLNGLVEEMDRRQEGMRRLDARNLMEARANGADMPHIVVVIDELADLILTRRAVETPLVRLAQKARSAGIHLVLATQRPEAATFPGLLRSSTPSRIALTVQKQSESRIILDEGGAESLLMRGDMLVRFAGRSTVRAHGCRVDQADIISAIRSS
ncbi:MULTISPECIES: FtsK/SpoIIIE domain-containing protein [unclassified Ensifer]|uniref:FtsK/SpoIIIE domain-containing protein n=1 Tax=unclassified Ensifer TaxID=2633371 RepID=UPI000812EBE0|nr:MULTISPECIES: FtsK/SpoIIIE domain-containing protein [unclassified Ensifer]OCP19775.1 hypothetical protein BC361_30110 [Ensifer sp. LC54]OCP25954.1 hypothetical protein BC363_19540 [Ensifer sp. LC384]